MLKNFILTALRNIEKYKGYSFINIFGLTLGITCSVLLLLYIKFELSYDKYHKNAEGIYRVATQATIKENTFTVATTPAPLSGVLKKSYREIKASTRIVEIDREVVLVNEDQYFEDFFYYADPDIFEIFDFDIIRENDPNLLSRPNSIVISEKIATKYFGNSSPIGATIHIGGDRKPLYVSGVFKNVRSDSHFRPEALISYASLSSSDLQNWVVFNDYTYLLFDNDYLAEDFQEKLDEVIEEYLVEDFDLFNGKAAFFLQPLTSIHLYSKLQAEIIPGGEISYVYIISAIAAFIIIIACINYMNLATARSTNRAKEVGLRKVAGSFKGQLIKQFIVESILFTLISTIISLVCIKYLMPVFNRVSGKELDTSILLQPDILIMLLGLILVVGFLAGSYPAFYLSSIKTVEVLKGKMSGGEGNVVLRKTLVVIQFGLSSIMLICTWIVYDQLEFLSNKNLGFEKENVIRISLHSNEVSQRSQIIAKALKENNNIQYVSTADGSPGSGNFVQRAFYVESNTGEMEEHVILNYHIDEHYIPALQIEMLEGRNFSPMHLSDSHEAVIVNQNLADRMGWEDPLGKKIKILISDDSKIRDAMVIGVIKNFHVRPLHEKIEPMILTYKLNNPQMLVKVDKRDIDQTVSYISDVWQKMAPAIPLDYSFIEDDLNKNYVEDHRKGKIFAFFSAVTVLIACLGLLGLASFTSLQRRKEISIRKVNGAGTFDIMFLLTKDFLIMIVLSILLAWPFAYYFMRDWLQNFAYKVTIEMQTFLFSTGLIIILTLMIVSFHTARVALLNPVVPLKTD